MDDMMYDLAYTSSMLPMFSSVQPMFTAVQKKPLIHINTRDICFKSGATVMVKDNEDKGTKLNAMRTIHTEIRIVDKMSKIHKLNLFGYSRLPIELERIKRARGLSIAHINDKFLGVVNILDDNRNIEEQIIDAQGQLFIIGTAIVFISEYEKVTPREDGTVEAALILKDKVEYVKIYSGNIIRTIQYHESVFNITELDLRKSVKACKKYELVSAVEMRGL